MYVHVHVYIHMYTPTPVVKFRKGFNVKTCITKAQKSPQQKNTHLTRLKPKRSLDSQSTRPMRRLPARGVKRSKCSDSTIIKEWLPPVEKLGISTIDPRWHCIVCVHDIFNKYTLNKGGFNSLRISAEIWWPSANIFQNLDDLHLHTPKSPACSQACTLHFNTLNLSWIQVIE